MVLFANYEIASGGVDGRFRNARVSRLVIDPAALKVQSGSYPTTGKTQGFLFQRLCSASFIGQAEGFGTSTRNTSGVFESHSTASAVGNSGVGLIAA